MLTMELVEGHLSFLPYATSGYTYLPTIPPVDSEINDSGVRQFPRKKRRELTRCLVKARLSSPPRPLPLPPLPSSQFSCRKHFEDIMLGYAPGYVAGLGNPLALGAQISREGVEKRAEEEEEHGEKQEWQEGGRERGRRRGGTGGEGR